jgi:SPP1 gp7 family putative phage head morphogenesis protein
MAIADVLADRLLVRDIDLARLEVTEQRRILALLRQLRRDLKTRLAAVDLTGPTRQTFQRQRLQKLLPEVDRAIRDTTRAIRGAHAQTLGRLARHEAATLATELNAAAGVDLFTAGLDPARLRTMLSDVVLEGAPLGEWWDRQGTTLRRRFTDEMRRGQLAGDSLTQLLRRVDDVMGVGERQAEALVRSSLITTQNHTRGLLFEANADVAPTVEWLTALDSRVCPICQALSGLQWDVRTKAPVGHSKRWPGSTAHVQCRCTQTAVVHSAAALFGSAPRRTQRQLQALPADVRQQFDGRPAIDQPFATWLRTRPATEQRRILGARRYELWTDGKVTLTQLTDQRHRPLTLEQLEAQRRA